MSALRRPARWNDSMRAYCCELCGMALYDQEGDVRSAGVLERHAAQCKAPSHERTIAIPPPVGERLERLWATYAERLGDHSGDARRLLELAVLQRGIAAVQRELDQAAPVAKAAE